MKKVLFGILTFLGIGLSFCSADGIYWNQSQGLISIVYNNGVNTLTVQDKNLGATCTDINDTCSYGNYYQFGNNFPFTDNPVNYTKDQNSFTISSYGPGNYFNSNGIFYQNLDVGSNFDVWGAVTGTPEAMQGPCPTGFHIVDSRQNVQNIFVDYFGFDSTSPSGFKNYLKMPIAGYIGYRFSENGFNNTEANYGDYWSSSSYSQFDSYFLGFSNNANIQITQNGYALSVRCFKNEAVSPDYTRTRLYGDVISAPPTIDVFYNNDNDYQTIICNGDNSIHINGVSSYSNNVFTPYFGLYYYDEDSQFLAEAYTKEVLYLSGATFKKTYTGNNDWILTAQGTPQPIFTGYLPVFEVTGTINENTGNIFNNFTDNALTVLLSNIPSYVQWITLIAVLMLLLSFVRRFRRGK